MRTSGIVTPGLPAQPEVLLGRGAASAVPHLARALGHDSAFVVSDAGVVAAGVAAPVIDALVRDGRRVALFDGVGRNPSLDTVLAGSLELRGFGLSVVVAVGGGSVIDAAKAIALHAANDVPVAELDPLAPGLQPAGPLIAVPTIAGAGAESTPIAVIDDPASHRSCHLGHASTLPRFAVLDPGLAAAAPPHLIAACAISALARAVETPGREGADAIYAHLPRAVADPADLEAHAALLLAAHRVGLATAGPGVGTARALGRALSARYGIPDGVALATVLALAAAHDGSERDPEIAALMERVGLRISLGGLLVPRRDLPGVAADALAHALAAGAPRPPAEAELLTLLEAAY